MRKSLVLMGRYTLLMFIAAAMGVGIITMASMPGWIARAGGMVGAGWLALRYLFWKLDEKK